MTCTYYVVSVLLPNNSFMLDKTDSYLVLHVEYYGIRGFAIITCRT